MLQINSVFMDLPPGINYIFLSYVLSPFVQLNGKFENAHVLVYCAFWFTYSFLYICCIFWKAQAPSFCRPLQQILSTKYGTCQFQTYQLDLLYNSLQTFQIWMKHLEITGTCASWNQFGISISNNLKKTKNIKETCMSCV